MEKFLTELCAGLAFAALTAVFMDRSVNVEKFEEAVSKCPENGGLKVYAFDSADATVTCNNGAVFYYKLRDKKQ